jgi:hypothetical protein
MVDQISQQAWGEGVVQKMDQSGRGLCGGPFQIVDDGLRGAGEVGRIFGGFRAEGAFFPVAPP